MRTNPLWFKSEDKYIIGGNALDIITSSFLDDFVKSNELTNLSVLEQFKYFCNYLIISDENSSKDFDLDCISKVSSAKEIDGVAIFVNNKIVSSIEEIQELLDTYGHLDIKFVFIQSTDINIFKEEDIKRFVFYVKSFFDEKFNYLFTSSRMQDLLKLKQFIYENESSMLHYKPILNMYFVSNGYLDCNKNLNIIIEKEELDKTNLFSDVIFTPCGIEKVQELYRQTINDLEVAFEFQKKVVMYSDKNGEIAYCGVLPFKEFKKLIMDKDKLRPVFKNSIQGFSGKDIEINSAIENSLKSKDITMFSILNNGITIVADNILCYGDAMRIVNYQILDGCKTSYVIYKNRYLDNIEDLMIFVKIIKVVNNKIIDKIKEIKSNETISLKGNTYIEKVPQEQINYNSSDWHPIGIESKSGGFHINWNSEDFMAKYKIIYYR